MTNALFPMVVFFLFVIMIPMLVSLRRRRKMIAHGVDARTKSINSVVRISIFWLVITIASLVFWAILFGISYHVVPQLPSVHY